MSRSKNNIGAAIGLGLALVLAIYILYQKYAPETGESESSSFVTSKPTKSNGGNAKSDTVFFEDAGPADSSDKELIAVKNAELNDYKQLDSDMKNLISRIDNALDRAHRIKTGTKKRNILLDKTEKLIDSALAAFKNPFFNVSMGDLKMMQGENTEAVKQYEYALAQLGDVESIRRNHAGACYNAAIEKINENDTDQAIILMESFNAFAPNDENGRAILMDWYKKRAVGLLRLDKNQRGLELCKKALSLDPYEHVAHFNAGIAHFRLNDYDKAIKRFESCLDINPKDKYSKNYLYTIYMNKGELEKAKVYETESINVKLPAN